MIFFCFAAKLARSGERVKHSSLRAGFAAQQKRVYNTTRLKSGEKTCRKNWPPNDADLSRGERSTYFYWVSTSGSQNGHQFDDLMEKKAGINRKILKLSKQFFLLPFEQKLQELCNFKGEFWHCFCNLRGNIFMIIRSNPAEEPTEV